METKDETSLQDIILQMVSAKGELDTIYDQLSKINGIKPIHFKNPEKLNGKLDINGRQFEIVFIGRELSLTEDNWTWVLNEKERPTAEHRLSVMKYPKTDGYANIIKVGYGVSAKKEILRNNLDSMNFMLNEIKTLIDLPF
jgi:hypothetical protein